MFGNKGDSSSEEEKKVQDAQDERRGSHASVRSRITVESLDELPDPDAGLSEEERKRIVRHLICATSRTVPDQFLG